MFEGQFCYHNQFSEMSLLASVRNGDMFYE